MKTYRYKGKMFDIDYSIISIGDLENHNRLEGEYYKPEYIEKILNLNSKKSLKLDEIGIVTDGEHGSPDLDVNSGIIYLSGNNVKDNILDLENIRFCSENLNKKNARSQIKKGNVLLSIVGTVGNSTVVYKDFRGNTDRNVATIKNIKENIDPYWISTVLNSTYGRFQTERFQTGNVQPLLNLTQVRSIKIPISTEIFQKQIEKLVVKAHQQKELSEKLYKESEKILLKALNLWNHKPKTKVIKLDGGVEIIVEENHSAITYKNILETDRFDAEYWDYIYEDIKNKINGISTQKLSELIDYEKGIEVGTSKYIEESELEENIDKKNFLRISNFSKFGLSFETSKYISNETFEEFNKYQPKKGEILFSKDGTAGITYLLRENVDGIISGGILRLQNKSNLPSEYIELVLNSMLIQKEIERQTNGALIQHLKITDALDFDIPIIEDGKIQEITENIQKSFEARAKSKDLLELAKKMVEVYIEQDEDVAMKLLNQ